MKCFIIVKVKIKSRTCLKKQKQQIIYKHTRLGLLEVNLQNKTKTQHEQVVTDSICSHYSLP